MIVQNKSELQALRNTLIVYSIFRHEVQDIKAKKEKSNPQEWPNGQADQKQSATNAPNQMND